MPSHNSRLKNRRALSGEDAKGQAPVRAVDAGSPPGRLRRLIALLLLTTALLAVHQTYRYYTRGSLAIKGLTTAKHKSPAVAPPAVGGMVVHPTANDHDDDNVPTDNSDVKLEDLDMDTLQAAFDALYGDGGPLGPQRGDGPGTYRVQRQGRKEKLG